MASGAAARGNTCIEARDTVPTGEDLPFARLAILLQGEVATIAGSSIIRIRLYKIYQERAWHNYTFADPQLF